VSQPVLTLRVEQSRLGSLIGANEKARLIVFHDLPTNSKYHLVLDKAEGSASTERALPGETGRRNPNDHRAVLAVTTAFWDAYLCEVKDA
jgi:hypothetical protein